MALLGDPGGRGASALRSNHGRMLPRGGGVRLPLPALRQIPGIAPQHPLQLLGRQPATEPSPRVLLGSLDERLSTAFVQAGAAVVVGCGDMPVWIAHDDDALSLEPPPGLRVARRSGPQVTRR